jgi:hypothetical protein
MFKIDDFVAITGGPWRGRRGLVRAISPGSRPLWLLVTIEREAGRGRHGQRSTVTTFAEHYVMPEHCEHLSAI